MRKGGAGLQDFVLKAALAEGCLVGGCFAIDRIQESRSYDKKAKRNAYPLDPSNDPICGAACMRAYRNA